MRRVLLWVLFLVALVLYSLVVYSWWQEANNNFERQRREAASENIIFRH